MRLGNKIRALRHHAGLSQTALADRLGISASYLNLIEHDRRALTATLLLEIAQVFQLDLASLTADGDARLKAELREVFADPLFENHPLTTSDINELILAAPGVVPAIVHLYHAWREAQTNAEVLALRVSEGMATSGLDRFSLPSEEVSDFLQRKLNYFPALESAAELLWERAGLEADDLQHGLQRYAGVELGIRVEAMRAQQGRFATREYDPQHKLLRLSQSMPLGSRNFQLAHVIGLSTLSDLLNELASDPALTTDASRALCRVALANYFAGAVTMPYLPFLEAAREERYDIELLANRFGLNIEQICHRLTTLRRPGAEGIPFHFLRVDIAGNISKRFSASGIRLSRFGACPRWNIHQAFLTPSRIITQISRMPDGTCYFSIARTVARDIRGYHVPRMVHAVTLGCQIQYAREMVYADGINLENLTAAVPIGTTCRMCERTDCEQRAHPPIQQMWKIDENRRGISFYAPTRQSAGFTGAAEPEPPSLARKPRGGKA